MCPVLMHRLLMFLADANIKGVNVVGPKGLTHYMASMRNYLWRVSMSLSLTEVPSEPVFSESNAPEPVYQDESITLYAVPIHISPGSLEGFSSGHFKRKRSPSPSSPSKRLQVDSSSEIEQIPVSLATTIQRPDFSPLALLGAQAEEWRRLTIENMFPYKTRPSVPGPSKKERRDQKQQNKQSKAQKDTAAEDQDLERIDNIPPSPPKYNQALPFKERRLPPFSYSDSGKGSKAALCYVLVGPRARGKFDVAKSEALGVPSGPLRGKLTKGLSVTFTVADENGNKVERVVRPEDCIGPTEKPQVMLLLDVPTPDHIPELIASFTENPFYARFRSKLEKDWDDYGVHLVFHLCGLGVLEDERYKAFMRGFADGAHHLVSSREHAADPATFTSAAYTQLRLNQLDAEMFPVPYISASPRRPLTSISGLPPKTELLLSNRLIEMRPPSEPRHDEQAQSYDHFHPAIEQIPSLNLPSAVFQSFAAAKARVSRSSRAGASMPKPGDDVEITPLGTSSALPSKYRNVSSTLVRIPKCGSILLDSGEGTWGQLARMFGDDVDRRSTGVWEVLRDLKCIFLSHMHGDHHIGLSKILAMRSMMNPSPSEPLYVVGLRSTILYLQEQCELEDLGLGNEENGVVPILADALNWRSPRGYAAAGKDDEPFMNGETSRRTAASMCLALGLESFTTVDVAHKTRCYGAVIKHRDGWSIVYSADTTPTNNLVRAGQNATLLIHEATMADDQEEMARDKAHSTCGQAITIAKRMNAEKLLLTHFSARYPKMPRVERSPPGSPSSARPRGPLLALAFDHARFKIADMWKLNTYLPAIERNFTETAAEEGDVEQDDNTGVSW
ncbi:uncharacterized protein FIBRA_02855 [Fibroporia radiculosa]|uniref:ribonuclease Z n=1 Tax=Fibroporia radiculosa TaxID=599839 RepID=J4G319_9APHY|nr:uncharacterized protein FIBRA_02855 [Fibroporia radiculosa]CCM00813.1 predicted protein [Fibroporia radiculosa]